VLHSKKVLIDNTYLLDNVLPFLNDAKMQGYQLAIVTSKYRDGLDNILAKFNLSDFFSFHIAGDEVTYTKPHPMSLERALTALEIAPHESIYVGDSVVDAEAAKRANMQFVGVLTGQTKKESFFHYPSFAIINDLRELLKCIS
jgi:phosphoglycolate phosphatase